MNVTAAADHSGSLFLLLLHLVLLLLPGGSSALSPDGLALLALKSAVSSDPTSALSLWDPNDADPCRWPGISCANISGFPTLRVVAVSVAGKNLSGYIPSELGTLPYLRRLNLHGNLLSGLIPTQLSNATSLHSLFLYGNNLTGPIPASSLCTLPRLQNLDLSSNALSGPLPDDLGGCRQLQRLLLNGNALSGDVPSGVFPALAPSLMQLDLSSNNFSGPIPPDIGELGSLSGVLNLSNNHFTGGIPKELGRLPAFVSVDLRDNDLSGEIPQIEPLTSHGAVFFLGNPGLCGPPLPNPCGEGGDGTGGAGAGGAAPSSRSRSNTKGDAAGQGGDKKKHGLSTWLIVVISVADAGGVALIGVLLVYAYWRAKDSGGGCSCTSQSKLGGHHHSRGASAAAAAVFCCSASGSASSRKGLLCCPRSSSRKGSSSSDEEDASSTSSSSSSAQPVKGYNNHHNLEDPAASGGELVAVDKGFAFELDELLRASAYVLGKSGKGGIVYKVVLGSGVPVAVRRVGGDGPPGSSSSFSAGAREPPAASAARYKEFAAEAQAIGRVRHPNVVRLRAYYWAQDEKLLISDFVPNGTLAAALRARPGEPTLSWASRLKIAKGVARGLAHIHECSPRKYVHGDIRPSNVLLDSDFTPRISDFGLARLASLVAAVVPANGAATDQHDQMMTMMKPVSGPLVADRRANSAYRAPEARLLPAGCRPAQKWDVYSFGVVLLEILTGRSPAGASAASPSTSYSAAAAVVDAGELVRWVRRGFEQDSPLTELLDPIIVSEVRNNKEALAAFHVALSCTETDPEIRPKMKTVADSLDKI